MDFFKKIKDAISAEPKDDAVKKWQPSDTTVERELHFFKDACRVGILANHTDKDSYDLITKYKKELDLLGYEADLLMFVNEVESPRYILCPHFSILDLDSQGLPSHPRTDRFIKKKFDVLFNLFFCDSTPLIYLANNSIAKCRYGAYRPHLVPCSDVFVYTEPTDNVQQLINNINDILQKQAYERKHV